MPITPVPADVCVAKPICSPATLTSPIEKSSVKYSPIEPLPSTYEILKGTVLMLLNDDDFFWLTVARGQQLACNVLISPYAHRFLQNIGWNLFDRMLPTKIAPT